MHKNSQSQPLNRFVIITTIFAPTSAVKKFSELDAVRVIVVGDKKSPPSYNAEGVSFLSWTEQETLDWNLVKVLPFNHYCRKMIGYLEAIKQGAEVIVDTDDDNVPDDHWAIPDFTGSYRTLPENSGFINIYELYTSKKIWPRGLPLRLINSQTIDASSLVECHQRIGIWQGLANGDPDVDAIYRLTNGELVEFSDFGNVVLSTGTISPFNSQNTAFRKELFPLLYLPSKVTFRFTDILRGIVAQPICWAAGYQIGFTNATVRQDRNPHDYMKDFESEIPMYLHTEKVFEIGNKVVKASASIADNLNNYYAALESAGIVVKEELKILDAWLADVA